MTGSIASAIGSSTDCARRACVTSCARCCIGPWTRGRWRASCRAMGTHTRARGRGAEGALAHFVESYGYAHAGAWVPATTLAALARRFAPDARVRWLFLDLKVPPDQPDLAAPLFQQAVQLFRPYDALA